MKNILILMAVYNGEKYLREQLDSIVAQDFTNWHMIVQDDGSTDGTEKIVREYEARDNRIEYVKNTTDIHGAFQNFYVLIDRARKVTPYDYYMFADQDDIWLPDKLSASFNGLEKIGKDDVPLLLYADMETMNAEGETIEKSLDQTWGLRKKNRYEVFFSHKIFGCTMIINRAMFDIVPPFDLHNDQIKIMSHDNHFLKYAALKGEFFFLPKVVIRYRRHGGNATSYQKYRVDPARFLRRIAHLRELGSLHARLYNQTLVTLDTMRATDLTDEQSAFVDEIDDIIHSKGFKVLRYLKEHEVNFGKRTENISRKLILFLGLHRKYLVR